MAKNVIKHIEVVEYEHIGVRVMVTIDYDREIISLTERVDVSSDKRQYDPKEWVFAKRSLEYMQGWQNILDAMKYAIECAEVELRKHVDLVARKKAALAKEVLKIK